MEVATEKHRFDGVAYLQERLIGGMLEIIAGKPFENGLSIGGPHPEGRGLFDHLIILLADEFPPYGASQNRLQMRLGVWLPGGRPVEFLAMDALETGEQLKNESPRSKLRGINPPPA